MALFLSEEWLILYQEALNNNKEYEKVASWWTGDFVFIVRASGSLDHDVMGYVGLSHGKCTGVNSIVSEDEFEVVPSGSTPTNPDVIPVEYTYEASQETWIEIIKSGLDPIRALLSGKARIKGEMGKVLRATLAAKELVRTATLVDTEFY
jgi:putative sterol carrier protein